MECADRRDRSAPHHYRSARVTYFAHASTQAIESATDVANMILRIDDVIAAKKGMAGPPPGAGGMPGGGMGGMAGMDM